MKDISTEISIKKPSNPLMAAVRELRLCLDESQQDFGIRLGLSTISVARYERSRAPRGKVLAKLADIAAEHGLDQLEEIFRRALSDEFGGPPVPGSMIESMNPEQKDLVLTFLEVLRRPQYAKEAEMVKRILEPIARQREEDADFFEAQQRGRTAIIRLLRKGYDPDSIKTRMGESIEKIADALFHSTDLELVERRAPEVVGLLEKDGWTIERVFQQFGQGSAGTALRLVLERSGIGGQLHKKKSGRKG